MIGIVGNGFVGNAVYQNVRDKAPTKVYDVDPNRSFSTLEEVLDQQYIFICLPTPMRMDGSCDLSILDSFFAGIKQEEYVVKDTVFIIKSLFLLEPPKHMLRSMSFLLLLITQSFSLLGMLWLILLMHREL